MLTLKKFVSPKTATRPLGLNTGTSPRPSTTQSRPMAEESGRPHDAQTTAFLRDLLLKKGARRTKTPRPRSRVLRMLRRIESGETTKKKKKKPARAGNETAAVQRHGFKAEGDFREHCGLPRAAHSSTRAHDIHAAEWARHGADWRRVFPNCDAPPHVSVKTTGSTRVCCGCPRRMHAYMRDATPHYIVVFPWHQDGPEKVVRTAYAIRSDTGFVRALFNDCPEAELDRLREFVKAIPKHTRPPDKAHTRMAKDIKARYAMPLTLNPKVDSKKQRRLQCSFNMRDNALHAFVDERDDLPAAMGLRAIPSPARTFGPARGPTADAAPPPTALTRAERAAGLARVRAAEGWTVARVPGTRKLRYTSAGIAHVFHSLRLVLGVLDMLQPQWQ